MIKNNIFECCQDTCEVNLDWTWVPLWENSQLYAVKMRRSFQKPKEINSLIKIFFV